MSDAQTLGAAIQALHHSSDRDEQARANAWLMAFMEAPSAWPTSLALLSLPASECGLESATFAANCLHARVKADAKSLNFDQAAAMKQQLLTVLSSLSECSHESPACEAIAPVIAKLSRTVAVIVLRHPAQLESLVSNINATIGQSSADSQLAALFLLESVGDEAVASMGGAHLNNSSTACCIEAVCSIAAKCLASSTASDDAQLVHACVRCLASWAAVGLRLTHLHHCQLLQPLIGVLQTGLNQLSQDSTNTLAQRLASSWLDLMESAIESDSFNLNKAPNEVLAASSPIFNVIFSIMPQIQLLAERKSIAPHAMSAETAASLVRHFAALLSSLIVGNIEAVQSGSIPSLAQILIELSSARHTARSLLPSLLSLADTPTEQRHPDFREPLWARLTESLIVGMSLPPAFVDWAHSGDGIEFSDEDEFKRLREDFSEVLTVASGMLGAQFLTLCCDRMERAAKENNWQLLEAASKAATAHQWSQMHNNSNPSLTLAIIDRFLASLLRVEPASAPVLLVGAISAFIQEEVTQLPEEINPPRLAESLAWLIRACGRCEAAGPAVKSLLMKRSRILANDAAIKSSMIAAINVLPSLIHSWPASCSLCFVQGVIAFIQRLSSQECEHTVRALTRVALSLIQPDVKQSPAIVHHALALLASVVDDIEVSAHQAVWQATVLEVLRERWPLIIDSACHTLVSESDEFSVEREFFDALFNRLERDESHRGHAWLVDIMHEAIRAYLRQPTPILAIILRSAVSSAPQLCEAPLKQHAASLIAVTAHTVASNTNTNAPKGFINGAWLDALCDHFLHLCRTPVAAWLDLCLDAASALSLIDLAINVCRDSSDLSGVEHAVTCLASVVEAVQSRRANHGHTHDPLPIVSQFELAMASRGALCVQIVSPLIFPDPSAPWDSSIVSLASEARNLIHQLVVAFPADCQPSLRARVIDQCRQQRWSESDVAVVVELAVRLVDRGDVWRHFMFTLSRSLPERHPTPALLAFHEREAQRERSAREPVIVLDD